MAAVIGEPLRRTETNSRSLLRRGKACPTMIFRTLPPGFGNDPIDKAMRLAR
jgi:hypothetical protein